MNEPDIDYIITCLSCETNYPVYGNPTESGGVKIWDIENFIKYNFNFIEKKIIIFQDMTHFYFKNIINVCYASKNDDKNSILICPPAIKIFNFNNNINKKYFMSFKGNINASQERFKAFECFSKYNNDKNIIIDRKNVTFQSLRK